jgi:hypothetical protein
MIKNDLRRLKMIMFSVTDLLLFYLDFHLISIVQVISNFMKIKLFNVNNSLTPENSFTERIDLT